MNSPSSLLLMLNMVTAIWTIFAPGTLPTLLGEAARRRGGEAVVNQPPGRRYTVLTIGGALFGVLLNLGTISLLGTMIREGVDAGRQKNRRPRFRNPVATYDLGHAARVLFDPDVVADHCDPGDHSGVAARYHLF